MIQLLFLLLLIPLGAGGLLLLFAGVSQQRNARWIALGGSLASLAISLLMAGDYRALLAERAAAAIAGDAISAGDSAAASAASPIQPQVEFREPWLRWGES